MLSGGFLGVQLPIITDPFVLLIRVILHVTYGFNCMRTMACKASIRFRLKILSEF